MLNQNNRVTICHSIFPSSQKNMPKIMRVFNCERASLLCINDISNSIAGFWAQIWTAHQQKILNPIRMALRSSSEFCSSVKCVLCILSIQMEATSCFTGHSFLPGMTEPGDNMVLAQYQFRYFSQKASTSGTSWSIILRPFPLTFRLITQP